MDQNCASGLDGLVHRIANRIGDGEVPGLIPDCRKKLPKMKYCICMFYVFINFTNRGLVKSSIIFALEQKNIHTLCSYCINSFIVLTSDYLNYKLKII